MATQRSVQITAQLGVDAESRRVAVLDGYTRDLQALVEQVRDEEREAHLRERAARDEGERLDKQLQTLQTRVQSNEQRLAGLLEGSQGEEERLQQIDAEAAGLEQSLREREERLQEAERNRRERQEMLQSLRVERARIVEKGDNLGRDVQRLTSLEATQRTNIDRLEKEISQATQDRAGLQEREAAATDQLTQKHENRESLATARDEQHNQWQEVMVRSRELEEEIGRLQRELSVQRERRHQLELRVTELRTELKQLLSRVTDEYEVDLPSLGPLEEDDFDAEKAKTRLEEIRRGLARLGNVHVGVLEEFEEQKERYDFLVQHRDDLIAASEDLRKTLQHIDRVARRLFRETFEEIREKFQVTYARFFPGGEADLTLEADVDPLESSIEITARPRGKRLQSIGLLSGGEKALTAIALLFAIYQVKPSPWCILDEVDAPLDDANVERFLRVLREFAQHTQFIMITHNKLSMSSADTLHGVTMAEEGVSQLVSVQVAEQAIDSEAAG
jgi:chromosome segregation protein